MVSLLEDKIKKKFEKDQRTFNNSSIISKKNKELVNYYIEAATDNRQNRSKYPYSYNATRYVVMKSICENCFPDRDLETLTRKDIVEFEKKLEVNTIKNPNNNEPYKDSYKSKFRKILTEFFKYHFGKRKDKFDELMINDYGSKILASNYKRRTKKPILKYNEVRKIIEECTIMKYRFFFAVLFDAGFRISEFLNLKFEDITYEKDESGEYYNFTVTEGTKTGLSRSVSLDLFPQTIKEYLDFLVKEKNIKDSDYIFPHTSHSCSNAVKKYIKEILNKENYKEYKNHSLRHSSATHFARYVAERGTSIYARYGWAYGSDEAREYIQLSEVRNKQEGINSRKAIVAEETKELKDELLNTSEELKGLKKKLNDKEDIENTLKKRIDDIYDTLERMGFGNKYEKQRIEYEKRMYGEKEYDKKEQEQAKKVAEWSKKLNIT